MFIKFDYRCRLCAHTEERFVRREYRDSQRCTQELCEAVYPQPYMLRLPASPKTTFRFADTKLKR